MTTDDVLNRIFALSGQPPGGSDARHLLHAYIACLTFDELCAAIAVSLGEAADVRIALRSRLVRLLGNAPSANQRDRLVTLVEDTIASADADKALRQSADALHSALIRHLPFLTQHHVLERWVNRGTRGAMARWLKAMRDMPSLFDAAVALSYWRATRDHRAAKILAYQAPRDLLQSIVGELATHCQQGWIISKAIMRSGCEDEGVWDRVRSSHPATYLYLCAQLRRPLADDDAFDLVWACTGMTIEGDRGLAIWALGQMGKVSVLDRIRDAADTLLEKDIAEMRTRFLDLSAGERNETL
jgi:hypothetical protein